MLNCLPASPRCRPAFAKLACVGRVCPLLSLCSFSVGLSIHIHAIPPPPLPQASLLQLKDTCRQERQLCARSPMPFAITQMVMSLSATLCRYGLAFFPACVRLRR
jgi:hypothetical protein